MHLEEYFEKTASDDIRIRGTRVGIESVLYEFIHREQPPEAIAGKFPTLTLEQVYATVLYYLHNKAVIDGYMSDWLAFGKRMRAEQNENPPPVVLRLRQLRDQRQNRKAAVQ